AVQALAPARRLELLAQALLARGGRPELADELGVPLLLLVELGADTRQSLLGLLGARAQALDLARPLRGARRRRRLVRGGRAARPRELRDRACRRAFGRGACRLERRLGARPLGALGRRRLERGGEPRPLPLGRPEGGDERLGALPVPPRLLEVGGQPRPVGRRQLEGGAQTIGLTAARRELGGEHGALGGPRRHLAAQLLALGPQLRQVGGRLRQRGWARRFMRPLSGMSHAVGSVRRTLRRRRQPSSEKPISATRRRTPWR